MLTLKYNTEESSYQVTLQKITSTTIQLTGNFPVKDSGFCLYKDHLLLGNYTAYKTISRTLDNGAQFSCNGITAPPDADNTPT